jgi:cell division protein FtsL
MLNKKRIVMKTIKLLSTVLAVAIVAVATAVEKPKMSVTPLSADKAVVTIQNNNASLFELSIHAQDGELVYYKQTTKPLSSYQKIYDFKNLKNGNYSMNLRVNDTRLIQDIQVASNGIYVGDSKLRIDPYFAFANDVLKLSYLNFDEERLSLNIYDENGLVYKSDLGKAFNVASGYDLSALKGGKYEVILSSLNNEFTFSLEK